MAILIDQPQWRAHGTVWSHLVSDSTLRELHDFAHAAGLPGRGFDLDHYDVPAERYDDLVAAGAVPVTRRELVHKLAASGLRVMGRDRLDARRRFLAARWSVLAPEAPWVGADLLDRWHEPHRAYHSPGHLKHALDSLAVVSGDTPPDRVEQFALWFHDAIYAIGVEGADNERASADLAGATLTPVREQIGLSGADVRQVMRLILVTAEHNPAPTDEAGARVSDADLAILGGSPENYAQSVRRIRREYAHVPDSDFRSGRAFILAGLLDRGPIFRTEIGHGRWEARAQENLSAELTALRVQARS